MLKIHLLLPKAIINTIKAFQWERNLSKKCHSDGCQIIDNDEFINWPDPGRFSKNTSFNELKNILQNDNNIVYSYVITTIDLHEGKFQQNGCAPNFQSECITLGTCKHQMRANREPSDWIGVWIAGFTHVNIQSGKNYLVYLMQVEKAFISYSQVWNEIGEKIREVKNSRYNPFGDVFEPKNKQASTELEATLETRSYELYHEPIYGHKHNNDDCKTWKDDIYKKIKTRNRRPSILIGNPQASYYWDKPLISYKGRSPRTKRHTMVEFLNRIQL